MELVISQLTRLGLSEVVMHLLGSKWSSNDLFDKSLEASTIFLDAGHVVTEENRVVQQNMVNYLLKDMGEPSIKNLSCKLAKSIMWAREQRQELRLMKKSKSILKGKINDALKKASIPGSSKNNKNGLSETESKKLSIALKKSGAEAEQIIGNVDPGNSIEIMRLFDLLCSGQYREGQLLMSNQEMHKEPVDFLSDGSKYIAEMAKDFTSKFEQLYHAYGALKSFMTGPCKQNQLHMAMETECVLVTNRILRELYKEATKIFKKECNKHSKKKEYHILNLIHHAEVIIKVSEGAAREWKHCSYRHSDFYYLIPL
jgi:hypothetical protein